MTKNEKCSKCEKAITAGKFYNFYTGKKGAKTLGIYKNREFFCPPCAEKEKADDIICLENLIKVEWEVGNQTDEEVIEFEKKWCDHHYNNSCRMPGGRIGETGFTLDFIQKAKQEFEPYLQKPEVVEKSFGGKIQGCGVAELQFSYLFAKSARDERYRKEIVGPTFAKILGGGDPNQEINTISSAITNPSDAQGSTRGVWKINGEVSIPYCWSDNEGGDCRYASFLFRDHKLALSALCQGLAIKEKELTGESPKPNRPKDDKFFLDKKQKALIKNYFLTHNVDYIKLTSDNYLMICYRSNGLKWKEEVNWNYEEKQIQSYLKVLNSKNPPSQTFLKREEVETWTETPNNPPRSQSSDDDKKFNKPDYALWISLSLGGVLLIGLIFWFFAKKKKKTIEKIEGESELLKNA